MNENKEILERPLNILVFSSELEKLIGHHRVSYNFNEVIKMALHVDDFDDLLFYSNDLLKSIDKNAVFITANKPRLYDAAFEQDFISGKCRWNYPATISFNDFPLDPRKTLNFTSITIMATYNPENGEIGGFSHEKTMEMKIYFLDKLMGSREDIEDFENENPKGFAH